jgi:ribA/ribD-fused uncharacterized protein
MREHFSADIEANIRILLPIRRAAIQQKLKVRLTGDKLFINNQMYTASTINRLPDSLKPSLLATREIDDHLFFYSGQSVFSNFSPANFSVDGADYSFSEQYIQEQKALLFKANDIAKQVMSASSPGEMKRLTSRIPYFDRKVWEDKVPEICYAALKNKFSQNPKLANILTSTGKKILVEASPYDKLWGIGFAKEEKNLLQKKSSWGKNLQGGTLMRIRNELSR